MLRYFRKIFAKGKTKAFSFLTKLWQRIIGKSAFKAAPEFKAINENTCRTDLGAYVTSTINIDILEWHTKKSVITNVLYNISTFYINVLKVSAQSSPYFLWLMLGVLLGNVSKNIIKFIQSKVSPQHAAQNEWLADAAGTTIASAANAFFLDVNVARYITDEWIYHFLAIKSENLLRWIGIDIIVAKKLTVFTSKYLVQAINIEVTRYTSQQETLSLPAPQTNDNTTQIPQCFEFYQEDSPFLPGNITQWAAVSLLPTSSACQAYFNSSAIDDFIKAQEQMCIYIKAFPGYGDQMAVINNYHHLREMGFKGMVTFIYDDGEPEFDNKARTFRLLNLPTTEGNYYAGQGFEVIAESQAKNFTMGRENPLLFNCFTEWPNLINVFISPHTGNFEEVTGINKVFLRDDFNNNLFFRQCGTHNQHLVRQIGTDIFPLAAPVSTLDMAEDYLQTVAGQLVVKKTPALLDFIALLKSNLANIMTVYGKTFYKTSFYNLFNFILGAHYAQKQLPQKPFVIAVMFPRDDRYLDELNTIINGRTGDVISLLKHPAKLIPQQLRSAISASGLRGNFNVLKISDKNAAQQLSNLRPGTITLVAFDALDNTVFNAIYTGTVVSGRKVLDDRKSSNKVLAAAFEGGGAFTTLSNAGTPGIPCLMNGDRIPSYDLSMASPKLRDRLLNLWKRACDLPSPEYWESYDVAVPKMIGEFLVDAHNPFSAVSRFFQQAQQQIARGDRLRHAIFFVTQLLSMQQQSLDKNEKCLHIAMEKFSKGSAALAVRHSGIFNSTTDSRIVELNPASNELPMPSQRIG